VWPSLSVVVIYTVDSKVELKTIRVNVKDGNERTRSLTRRGKQLAKMRKRAGKKVTVGGPSRSLPGLMVQILWRSTSVLG